MAVRFPHHYLPATWSKEVYLVFFGAVTMGVGGVLINPPRANSDICFLTVITTVLVVVGCAVGWTEAVEPLNRLLPWRLSSFLVFGGLLAGAAGMLEGSMAAAVSRSRVVASGLLVGGAMVTIRYAQVAAAVPVSMLFVVAPTVALLQLRGFSRVSPREATQRVMITCGIVLVIWAPSVADGVRFSRIRIQPDNPERASVYEWVRTYSEEGSVFLTPPNWDDFRLNARRAIVADWKCVPLRPDEIREWYKRVTELAGGRAPLSEDSAAEGYWLLSCDQLMELSAKFGAHYAVVRNGRDPTCGTIVHSSAKYDVVDVRPSSTGARKRSVHSVPFGAR
jgi:hypothetical protein